MGCVLVAFVVFVGWQATVWQPMKGLGWEERCTFRVQQLLWQAWPSAAHMSGCMQWGPLPAPSWRQE